MEKNRHLPLYQMFEALQLEFLVADLRFKIFPRPKDKEYWKKVKEGKKAKIEDIAVRNGLDTIFSNPERWNKEQLKLYPANSKPAFTYRDFTQQQELSYWDEFYYYKVGEYARVMNEDIIGKIQAFSPFDQFLTVVDDEGNKYKVETIQVRRIL